MFVSMKGDDSCQEFLGIFRLLRPETAWEALFLGYRDRKPKKLQDLGVLGVVSKWVALQK